MQQILKRVLLASLGVALISTPTIAGEIGQKQSKNLSSKLAVIDISYQEYPYQTQQHKLSRNISGLGGYKGIKNTKAVIGFTPIETEIPGVSLEPTNLDPVRQKTVDNINRNLSLSLQRPTGQQEGIQLNVNLNRL